MTSMTWGTRTADSTRGRQGGVQRLLDWWCEGLAAALAGLATTMRPPRRFRFRSTAAPFVLHTVDRRGAPTAIELPDRPASGIPAEVLRRTRGSIIEVLVPQARLAFESTLSSYQTGKTMFDSILSAESTYLRLQLDYYQYLAEHIKAIVDYEAILKGAGAGTIGARGSSSASTAQTGSM